MMKKIILPLIVLIALAISTTKAQTQINPQIGINVTSFTNVPAGFDASGDIGLLIGSDFRFGGRFFLQPGIFITGTNTSFTYKDDGTNNPQTQTSDITTPGLKLKLMGGWRIIKNDVFGIRLAVGPTYNAFFDVSADGNTILITNDDFNNGTFNGDVSVGLDVLFLTFDLGYSYGFSDAIKTSTLNGLENAPKYQSVYFTLGVNLGKGKKKKG